MSEIVKMQQVVIGPNGAVYDTPSIIERAKSGWSRGSRLTIAKEGSAIRRPYDIAVFDNDYRAFVGVEQHMFTSDEEAKHWCAENSRAGFSYSIHPYSTGTPITTP